MNHTEGNSYIQGHSSLRRSWLRFQGSGLKWSCWNIPLVLPRWVQERSGIIDLTQKLLLECSGGTQPLQTGTGEQSCSWGTTHSLSRPPGAQWPLHTSLDFPTLGNCLCAFQGTSKARARPCKFQREDPWDIRAASP